MFSSRVNILGKKEERTGNKNKCALTIVSGGGGEVSLIVNYCQGSVLIDRLFSGDACLLASFLDVKPAFGERNR